ncbi:MAG TPA: hypothetical protein VFA47_09210, partial [Candidatus Manganitrophaceae bacterium]|nr:hypothetical protein [Candidatus Manganitrophaceae bacterium]
RRAAFFPEKILKPPFHFAPFFIFGKMHGPPPSLSIGSDDRAEPEITTFIGFGDQHVFILSLT